MYRTLHRSLRRALAFCVAALAWQGAAAQSDCRSPAPECVEVGKLHLSVSLGAGTRTNPVHGRSDIPLVIIPHVSYYGKRFFIENLELGFTLYETPANTFNLIAAPGYDRVFFVSRDLQNILIPEVGGTLLLPQSFLDRAGMEYDAQALVRQERRTTYMAGPEWGFSYGRFVGQVNALWEFTGEHDGYEVRAALAAPLLQSKSSLVASAGMTWKSAALVRYYYGIERVYEPGSALNPFLKLGYSVPLSSRVTFSAFAHYEYLDEAVARSPIVSDHGVATVFAGLVFRIL